MSDERIIQTSNYMMSTDYTSKFYDERVTGGKTGSTDKAGRCLAITAEANGMKLLGLVMGAKATYAEEGIVLQTHGNFEEMKVLLDFACDGFEYRQIFYGNQALKQYPVSGGANDVVTQPTAELSTVLPIGVDETKLKWVFGDAVDGLKAPVEKGQTVSNVQVWYEGICLAQTDLVAVNGVDAYQKPVSADTEDDTDGSVSTVWLVVCILVGVVLLGVGTLFVLRAVSAARMRRRRRRMRRDRRRNL
jgi:D-alanyl-D-alanine carboxypeptidase (penicillin-binding protein 5/6)